MLLPLALLVPVLPVVASKLLDAAMEDTEPAQKVKPGDVLSVHRFIPVPFKHYGVYIGDGKVIHYDTNPREHFKLCIHEAPLREFISLSDGFYICEFPQRYGEPLEVRAQGPQAALLRTMEEEDEDYERKCREYHLYSPEETVARAKEKLGETEYNLVTNNCEHFAIWCKTGISESHQIEDVLSFVAETLIAALPKKDRDEGAGEPV